jgi:hypothetical protein
MTFINFGLPQIKDYSAKMGYLIIIRNRMRPSVEEKFKFAWFRYYRSLCIHRPRIIYLLG